MKIETPQQLQNEIRRIQALASQDAPSREKLAAELNELASKVAGTDKTAGIDRFPQIYEGFYSLASRLESMARDHRDDPIGPRFIEDEIRKAETLVKQLKDHKVKADRAYDAWLRQQSR